MDQSGSGQNLDKGQENTDPKNILFMKKKVVWISGSAFTLMAEATGKHYSCRNDSTLPPWYCGLLCEKLFCMCELKELYH